MAATEPQPAAATGEARARPRPGVVALVLGLAVAIVGIDQLAKYLVVANLQEGVTVPFVGELVQLHFVRNAGAAFSLGVGATWLFAIVGALVAVFIIVFIRRIRSMAWATVFGMLLGGLLGNLLDRLFREPSFGQGHVIDFIQLWGFPAIFNVADVAITFSVVILVLLTLIGVGLDGHRARKAGGADPVHPMPDESGSRLGGGDGAA